MGRKKIVVKEGDQYGRLTVIREDEKRGQYRYFLCRCDCGKVTSVRLSSLRNATIVSCGCYGVEALRRANTKHGMSNSLIYRVHHSMKNRCLNKNDRNYKNYGGRGIKICDEWLNFESFYEWSQKSGYKKGLTIERINVNQDYCPENCEWIPLSKQNRNTRSNIRVNFDGKIQILSDWAKETGINFYTLRNRLNYNWTIEESLTTPAGVRR